MKFSISLVHKLLKLGFKEEDPPRPEFVMTPGPVYVRIIKRIQDQTSLEHADPRAVKVFHALSKRPTHLETPIAFSFRPIAQRTVFVHSKD
jgi:hypothetical protein